MLFLLATTLSFLIPPQMYNSFTCDKEIPVIYNYSNDAYSSSEPIVYTREQIQGFIEKAKAKETMYYGETDLYLYQAIERYISHIGGKSVAVIGSVIPWYESILLAYGAFPTTVEYNKIISLDPRLKVCTVDEYDADPQLFDAILSISSFEHDGLGRYGDPINPNGDLEAMEKTKKMLKKEGLLFLAVPIGKDCLVWNLHRIYGKLRLKALLKGWRIVEYFGFSSQDLERTEGSFCQPIFVLKQVTHE